MKGFARSLHVRLRSFLETAAGKVEDNVPEDTAVVVNTPGGLIVISGCGHAGIINTLECSRKAVRRRRLRPRLAAFHLFGATDEVLEWTGSRRSRADSSI